MKMDSWASDCIQWDEMGYKQKILLLAYPNFSEPFDIHMDASLYQLGACISQNRKPIAFYLQKLNPA